MSQFYRGTAIVETNKGIMLGESKSGLILLPGGRAKRGESRFAAAIRELREETGLKATCAISLFEYEDARDRHKVLWIAAYGKPYPKDDVIKLHYCQQSEISKFEAKLTNATNNILKLFWGYKENHESLFKELKIAESLEIKVYKSGDSI